MILKLHISFALEAGIDENSSKMLEIKVSSIDVHKYVYSM